MLVIPKSAQGYAVVIPKKVAKLSSSRNRLKRRVLEALRDVNSLPPSLIVFPRFSANSVNYQNMVTELSDLISFASK